MICLQCTPLVDPRVLPHHLARSPNASPLPATRPQRILHSLAPGVKSSRPGAPRTRASASHTSPAHAAVNGTPHGHPGTQGRAEKELVFPAVPEPAGACESHHSAHAPHEVQDQQVAASGGEEAWETESESEGESEGGVVAPVEAWVEQRVLNSRFLTLAAVLGSLCGSALCFLKGSILVGRSMQHYLAHFFAYSSASREILYLVEALDVYLMGTVMLIFGMGLYELFVGSMHFRKRPHSPGGNGAHRKERPHSPGGSGSNLFGLFELQSRPKWLRVESLDEMKTKLGHVIVMMLLVGMFERSKKVATTNANELLVFSVCVVLAAVCLFILSRLHPHPQPHPHPHSHEGAGHNVSGHSMGGRGAAGLAHDEALSRLIVVHHYHDFKQQPSASHQGNAA